MMSEVLLFPDRKEFRKWLHDHGQSSPGVWLLFGKAGGPKTVRAGEALEEALCFGWIDGLEAGREKRLVWMVERLNKNLKPM